MSPEKMRRAIAESRGVHEHQHDGDEYEPCCKICKTKWAFCEPVPDYPNDLNAIHAAVISQFKDPISQLIYHTALTEAVSRATPSFLGYHLWDAENATALQRCQAYLIAIGKMEE